MTAIVYTLVLLWPASGFGTAYTQTIHGNISTLAECNRIGHKLYDKDNGIPWDCVETKIAIPMVGK